MNALRRVLPLVAVGATVLGIPSGAAAATCSSGSSRIHGLRTTGVTCSAARIFARARLGDPTAGRHGSYTCRVQRAGAARLWGCTDIAGHRAITWLVSSSSSGAGSGSGGAPTACPDAERVSDLTVHYGPTCAQGLAVARAVGASHATSATASGFACSSGGGDPTFPTPRRWLCQRGSTADSPTITWIFTPEGAGRRSAVTRQDDGGDDAPAAVAPELRVEQTSGVRARDGAIRLRLSCPQGVAGSCDAQIRITAGSTLLATGHAEIYNGSAAVVSFGMTKAGKALFKKKASVSAKVTIATRDDDGGTATTTTKLSIARA